MMNRKIILVFTIVISFGLIVPTISSISHYSINYENEERLHYQSIPEVQNIIEGFNIFRKHGSEQLDNEQTKNCASSFIEEFTWSVLRYDHPINSLNFGQIHIPTPSQGTVMVPADMMSFPTCLAAINIYQPNKMDTLYGLEEYDVDNMVHIGPAFFDDYDEWHSPLLKGAYRKEYANEMEILGDVCLQGSLVGDCYAQAAFNTAILRLCGFSAEEVFTVAIYGHAINIVNVNEQWYAFDSAYSQAVKKGYWDSLIFEIYDPPMDKFIILMENDKYFINFGIPGGNWKHPYSNMNSSLLRNITDEIIPLFNHSRLGYKGYDINEFFEIASPCPEMKTIAVPYAVPDAVGSSDEEKAQSLASLTQSFIINQTGEDIPNQYDKSRYVFGFLSVDYPQAYANAAKYAAWTSFFGTIIDSPSSSLDRLVAGLWIRGCTRNQQVLPKGCVSFSDLPYLCHTGSSIDQAVMAYGTLRNMKKNDDFWQPDDLYVIVTKDYEGFLAVNRLGTWEYVNFGNGNIILAGPPEDPKISFNEIECLGIWGKSK